MPADSGRLALRVRPILVASVQNCSAINSRRTDQDVGQENTVFVAYLAQQLENSASAVRKTSRVPIGEPMMRMFLGCCPQRDVPIKPRRLIEMSRLSIDRKQSIPALTTSV